MARMPADQSTRHVNIAKSTAVFSESSQERMLGRDSLVWEQRRQKPIKVLNASIVIFQLSLASLFSLSLKALISKILEYILLMCLRVRGRRGMERNLNLLHLYIFSLLIYEIVLIIL